MSTKSSDKIHALLFSKVNALKRNYGVRHGKYSAQKDSRPQKDYGKIYLIIMNIKKKLKTEGFYLVGEEILDIPKSLRLVQIFAQNRSI